MWGGCGVKRKVEGVGEKKREWSERMIWEKEQWME